MSKAAGPEVPVLLWVWTFSAENGLIRQGIDIKSFGCTGIRVREPKEESCRSIDIRSEMSS